MMSHVYDPLVYDVFSVTPSHLNFKNQYVFF